VTRNSSLLRRLWLSLPCAALIAGSRASAHISIEIEGVDTEIKRNIQAFLSLERYAKSNDLDSDLVERLTARAAREVAAAVRPFGYYEPVVDAKVEPANGSKSDWRARITVELGKPVLIDDIDIQVTGPGADDRPFRRLLSQSGIREGDRLNHAAYEKIKGDLQRSAASHGYLDATFERSEMLVDPPNHTAGVYITLATGERYKFGKTDIRQDAIDEHLMRRYLRYREGANFDATLLLRTQFALDDSQYFSGVEVLPGDKDEQSHTVPVAINAVRNKRDRYTIGLGYGTDTRFRGTLGWDDRLVNRQGHHSHIEIKASQVSQLVQGSYIVPIGDPALEKVGVDLSIGRQELADTVTTGTVIRPGITQVLGRWQRVFFLEGDNTTTTFAQGAGIHTDTLLIPGISYASIPSEFIGQPIAGRGLFAELIGSTAALGSNSTFLRFHLQDERTFDLLPKWHLHLRGELGLSAVRNFEQLPPDKRFFAGGDRSIRGFALDDLSPFEQQFDAETGEPLVNPSTGHFIYLKTGARHLVVGSVEVERDLPRNFGLAVFMDGGNAINNFHDPLMYSVGIGLRWKLPAVSVGIDIAQALTKSQFVDNNGNLSTHTTGPRLHLNIQPIFK
jgi:translocation and assembly module TamA